MNKFEDKLDTVLIVDDEPFQTEWMTEYFEARGYKVVQADDLQAALTALDSVRYAYVVIDLSIPVTPALQQPLTALGAEFYRYPGLMAARRARSTAHNSWQVIVYSVHDSSAVETYSELIDCRYILKGRPGELKYHIENTMKRKPHGWVSTRPPVKGPRRVLKRPPGVKPAVRKKKPVVTLKRKSFYSRYPALVTAIKKKAPI